MHLPLECSTILVLSLVLILCAYVTIRCFNSQGLFSFSPYFAMFLFRIICFFQTRFFYSTVIQCSSIFQILLDLSIVCSFPSILRLCTLLWFSVRCAETINEFFVTVTDSLAINENFNDQNASDPVEKAVKKCWNHPSILKIIGHYQNAGPFVFQNFALDAVDKEIRNLNPQKAATHKNLPPKIFESNSDVCVEPLTQIFNDCIENSTFSDVTSLPKSGPTNTRYLHRHTLNELYKLYVRPHLDYAGTLFTIFLRKYVNSAVASFYRT